MISVRTFGTSEKNCNANIPATAPNPPSVIPLLPETCQFRCLSTVAVYVAVGNHGREFGTVGGYTI